MRVRACVRACVSACVCLRACVCVVTVVGVVLHTCVVIRRNKTDKEYIVILNDPHDKYFSLRRTKAEYSPCLHWGQQHGSWFQSVTIAAWNSPVNHVHGLKSIRLYLISVDRNTLSTSFSSLSWCRWELGYLHCQCWYRKVSGRRLELKYYGGCVQCSTFSCCNVHDMTIKLKYWNPRSLRAAAGLSGRQHCSCMDGSLYSCGETAAHAIVSPNNGWSSGF